MVGPTFFLPWKIIARGKQSDLVEPGYLKKPTRVGSYMLLMAGVSANLALFNLIPFFGFLDGFRVIAVLLGTFLTEDVVKSIGVFLPMYVILRWTGIQMLISVIKNGIEKIRKVKSQKAPKFGLKPSDFIVDGIYRMAVASRSHVTKPYYVIVISVLPSCITTFIPGHHLLTIKHPSPEWDYHIPRMMFVKIGDMKDDLINNQKLD